MDLSHMRKRQEIDNNSVEFFKCGSGCCLAGKWQVSNDLKGTILRKLDCTDCTFL